MKTILLTPLLFILLLSCKNDSNTIRVEWADLQNEDYSFTQEWSYPEGIYRNEFGQLTCDGLCDERLYKMMDENGRIYADSLSSYYQIADTAHYFHTLQSEAQTLEWAGTDFANAYRKGDTIKCYTETNASTHSSLEISIIDNKCSARIKVNSIAKTDTEYFDLKEGYIKIGKAELDKNILKVEFDFTSVKDEKSEQSMWWKGKIFTKIENNQ